MSTMTTTLANVSVSGWVDIGPHGESGNPELAAWFDAATRRGLTLSLVSGGGGYSSQGDAVRLSVGIDDGTAPAWHDCGAPNPDSRYISNSLTVSGGALYAASTDAATPDGYAHVYRHLGGQSWLDLGRPPGVDARGIGPMVSHDGALHVASWTYDWTRVGALLLGPVHGYRLGADDTWTDLGPIGAARRIFGMASYAGELYASADDDHVYRHRAGRWESVTRLRGYPHPLHVADGRLWVGTVDPGELWSFDGTAWYDEGNPEPDPADASQLHSFARPGGHLAVGTWPLGHVLRRDAGRWVSLGGPAGATEINGLQLYNGMLYAGALPYAELSRYDAAAGWTSIRRFNEPDDGALVDIAASGWQSRQDMAVAGAGDDADDSLMRDWGRVTSMVEHDGRLFVSTGNSTSSYDDSPNKTMLGRVFALSAGTVATTAQALSPGRHHVAAVRDGAALALYVDGRVAATAEGQLDSPIAMPQDAARRTGELAGARWFDRALTAQEVEALCAAGPRD
jgi:hypothetical protein